MTNLQIELLPSSIGCDSNIDGTLHYSVSYKPQYASYPPGTPGKKPFEKYEVIRYGIFDLDEPDFVQRYWFSKFPIFKSIEEAQKYLDLKTFW